ncbi:futalosine hydrolase [Salibacterium aidingense]|uniref:futalosine hydrolase n=1 Tax=Salibacterium aidingense TaxID=384933 RepID=UPI003BBC21DB
MAGNKILIVTAVDQERDAVHKGLGDNPRFDVIAGGVGLADAAVSTALALHDDEYKAVVSSGIAGGFDLSAAAGSIVIASVMVSADAGSETKDAFFSLEDLNLGRCRYTCDAFYVEQLLKKAETVGRAVETGPVLTTMTATGSEATAQKLLQRFPGAKAEAMEGYGVAAAARRKNIPAFELRSISNTVGPRDRENWNIREALTALEQVSPILQEVF